MTSPRHPFEVGRAEPAFTAAPRSTFQPVYATAVCSTFRRNVIEGDGGLASPDAPTMMCRDAACPVHGAPEPAASAPAAKWMCEEEFRRLVTGDPLNYANDEEIEAALLTHDAVLRAEVASLKREREEDHRAMADNVDALNRAEAEVERLGEALREIRERYPAATLLVDAGLAGTP